MRKRKSPIVLVTALVIIVAGVSGLQYAWSRTNGPASAPPTPEVADAKSVGEARASTPAKAVSAGILGAMNASAKPTGRPSMPGGPDSGPLILNRAASAKPEKPKPNTSSTSAQWYNDESALSKEKG